MCCRKLLVDYQNFLYAGAGLVDALVDAANDREEQPREAIFKSLVDIGRKKHNTVLETTHGYLTKHSKVSLARSHTAYLGCLRCINLLYLEAW